MKREQDLIATIILTGFLFSFGLGHSAGFAKPPMPQNQLITVGILSFQDESGSNAPSESGQKIAQELQQKLVAGYKDLLPRMISAGDAAEIKALTVEQLVALGKQSGVKFVVRGGLLAVSSESAGAETKINIQLYAEIASTETGSTSSVRAEGNGAQTSAASDITTQLSSIDFRGTDFRASALGQALAAALEQLAASIHQAVITPQTASPGGSTQTGTETNQSANTDAQAAQAAEADAELQQLIAQAESLLTSNSSSTESLSALSQALEGVKTALATKTTLMEQSQDTAQVDQQLAARQQELQTALTKAMEEAATTGTTTGEAEQPTGEKKGFMARIDEFAGQSLSLLQKIQEMRAALRGFNEEQSAYPAAEGGDPGAEAAIPSEGSVEEVSGVITEDGAPVEGATVTDEESGLSTTTDSSGSYALKGLLSGKLSKLIVSKGSRRITTQVEVFARRANVADLQFKPASTGSARSLVTVLPSTVVVNAIRSAGAPTGQVRGVVRDALGNPVARALVTLRVLGTARTSSPGQYVFPDVFANAHHVHMGGTKLTDIRPETRVQMQLAQRSKNLGVARTNSLGQYAFLNVPAGAYQLTINHSGLKLKTAQVQVGQKKIAEANFKFSQSDAIARLPMTGRSLIAPGAATVVRGTVLDDQNRPVAGARVSAVQSDSVISVFTGMNGTFELRNLKPGAYRVTIFKVGYSGATQQLALRPAGVEQRKFQIKKQSSPMIAGLLRNESARRSADPQRTALERRRPDILIEPKSPNTGLIAPRPGQLSGSIRDAANGKPLSGVSVSLPGQPSIKTDQQGNYRFGPLAPGNYQVSAKLNGYISERRTIAIRSGASARQDLALRSERGASPNIVGEIRRPPVIIGGPGVRVGQVTGQVIDSRTGKPISGASISTTGQRNILTNAEGRFAFPNLAPGTYQISVGKIGFSSGQTTVAIRAGQTATANFKLDPRSLPPVRLRLP